MFMGHDWFIQSTLLTEVEDMRLLENASAFSSCDESLPKPPLS